MININEIKDILILGVKTGMILVGSALILGAGINFALKLIRG